MRKQQIAAWNMGTSAHQVLVKFTSVYDGSTTGAAVRALVTGATELGGLLGEIGAEWKKQQARNGASLEKAAALLELGDAGFEIAGAVHACAAASGDTELAGKIDYGRFAITAGPSKTVLNRAEEIHEAAAAILNSLGDYGVTQTKLDAFKTRIEAFRKAHAAPRQRVTESSAATRRLKVLFPKLNALLRKRIDRLVVQFKTSAPEFFNQYQSARVVVNGPTISSAPAETNSNGASGTAPLAQAA